MTRLTGWIARLAHTQVRGYRLNWILRSPDTPVASERMAAVEVRHVTTADSQMIGRTADAAFRASMASAHPDASNFVLTRNGRPCGVAFFVGPDKYKNQSVWPLAPGQLALIDIVTNSADQGQGVASRLIASATPEALAEAHLPGPAICFIWWNHRASLRAFHRAGWRRIGFSIEVTGLRGRVWRRHVRLRRVRR